MNTYLPELIEFLTRFQKVDRQIFVPELGRKENDTEHTYNLAMAAWMIIAKDKLSLDLDKVIKYALVHDLVEAYADDAFVFDEKQVAEKEEKEHSALQKLWGDGITKDFAVVIEQYEKMEDEESKFVYGLDKLMPAFTLIQGKVPTWKEYGVTLESWSEKFGPKVTKSKYLRPYLEQLMELQKQNPELLASK